MPHEPTDRPYEKIGADLLVLLEKTTLFWSTTVPTFGKLTDFVTPKPVLASGNSRATLPETESLTLSLVTMGLSLHLTNLQNLPRNGASSTKRAALGTNKPTAKQKPL